MGVWKLLADDGPLYHTVGGDRIFGDKPQGKTLMPYVWVDPLASGCEGLATGDGRCYRMVVKAMCGTAKQAHLVMASILGALADGRPDEYLKAEGYEIKGGVSAVGAVAAQGDVACVVVESVIHVGPVVGSAH